MIIDKVIYFNKFYKSFNIVSIFFIIASLCLLIFKGLNYGVDFKGGTLIELRADNKNVSISEIRSSLNSMDLLIPLKSIPFSNSSLCNTESRNISLITYSEGA